MSWKFESSPGHHSLDRLIILDLACGPALDRRRRMRLAGRSLGLLVLAGLCACSDARITEDTPAAVSVRYDGVVQTLNDAPVIAQRTCAAHGKTARLRSTDMRAILERFAHFDCVSG